jgi:hypothetical protein
VDHLCVDLTNNGSVRRIELYSLPRPSRGNFVLDAIRSDSGEHRSDGARFRKSEMLWKALKAAVEAGDVTGFKAGGMRAA